MIKNDLQLTTAQNRMTELVRLLRELEAKYPPQEFQLRVAPLRDEMLALRAEIDQYVLLSQIPLEDAVQRVLQEGVLIENIGELLAKLRIAAKLTQAQLAERLGWHQPNVSRFESSTYSGHTVAQISEYLDAIGVFLHVRPSLTDRPVTIHFAPHPPKSEQIDDDVSTAISSESSSLGDKGLSPYGTITGMSPTDMRRLTTKSRSWTRLPTAPTVQSR